MAKMILGKREGGEGKKLFRQLADDFIDYGGEFRPIGKFTLFTSEDSDEVKQKLLYVLIRDCLVSEEFILDEGTSTWLVDREDKNNQLFERDIVGFRLDGSEVDLFLKRMPEDLFKLGEVFPAGAILEQIAAVALANNNDPDYTVIGRLHKRLEKLRMVLTETNMMIRVEKQPTQHL